MRSGLKSLAVSCAAFLVSVYLAEGLLRLWYVLPTPLARRYPLGLGLAGSSIAIHHREFDIKLTYNLAGFRTSEIRPVKEPNKKRLLFFGDSFTEGYGVDTSQRFSTKLVEALNTDDPGTWEEINAAQLITEPDSYYYNLVDFGVALRPDVVVMAIFMGNDFNDARDLTPPSTPVVHEGSIANPQNGALTLAGVVELRYVRALVGQWFGQRQLLYRRVGNRSASIAEVYFQTSTFNREWYLELMSPLHVTAEQFDAILSTIDPEIVPYFFNAVLFPSVLVDRVVHTLAGDERAGWEYNSDDVEHILEWIVLAAQVCAARNIQFVVTILPYIGEVEPESFARFLKKMGYQEPPKRLAQVPGIHVRIVRELRDRGIMVSDPTEALRLATTPSYYPLDQHLTPSGHEIVAKELYRTVQALTPANNARLGEADPTAVR